MVATPTAAVLDAMTRRSLSIILTTSVPTHDLRLRILQLPLAIFATFLHLQAMWAFRTNNSAILAGFPDHAMRTARANDAVILQHTVCAARTYLAINLLFSVFAFLPNANSNWNRIRRRHMHRVGRG